MTPGEAKRSYAFIRNAILESENASYNEVERSYTISIRKIKIK